MKTTIMKLSITRMHASRMRTVRCSGRLGGGSAWGGVCPVDPLDPEADTPLSTEFLTHACENITFPQLLFRMVIIE